MLTEFEKGSKLLDIQHTASKAAKSFKARNHQYKSKGKKAKRHYEIKPPNPYKPGSQYYKFWRDAFTANLT